MKKNILVTGAGALLGQGVLRLLQIVSFDKKIFTADPDARSTGHWLGDCALSIPKVNEKGYIEALEKIVANYKIDAILIGTDVELEILAKHKVAILEKYDCKVIVSSEEVIKIADDKFKTARFLKNNDFPYPVSVMANDKDKLLEIEEKFGFPLFAKPRDGARSMGIKTIKNHDELMKLYHPESNLVVQQFLPNNEGEYTSGCVVVDGKCEAIVTMRRDLKDGNTYRAYRDEETAKYDQTIIQIAEKLKAEGPVNFQFRVLNGKPIVFEINCRFSGTTPLRYFYGFNEVDAMLKYYLFKEPIHPPTLKKGLVMRTWSDVFVDYDEIETLKKDKVLENLNPNFFNFSLKDKL